MSERESPHWKSPQRKVLYEQLVSDDPLLELPHHILKQVAEDRGGLAFLKAWRFWLLNEESLKEGYDGQYVVISGNRIIASSADRGELDRLLPPRYQNRLIFVAEVRKQPGLILQAS